MSPLYVLDLAGNARVSESTVDIGAYEALPLGIETPVAAGKITFLPNPTSNLVYISGAKTDLDYTVYGLNGQKLTEGVFTASHPAIDFTAYASGLYLLKLSNGETHRILKK
ncbi:T9SS type A sorting domain-containing protein [Flavobacterium sp. 3HN19-14]|uniref:T9SS type A sorting domain-containing protein n=1 Tax=Flavobacterium sp. 3HN19-14 TaxID=3448133 RepID=UPI003EE3929E